MIFIQLQLIINMSKEYLNLINDFNDKYPVGTSVKLNYSNEVIETKVRSEAYLFEYNQIPVAFFENIGGVIDIRKVIDEE